MSKTDAGSIGILINRIYHLVVGNFEAEILGHVDLGPVVAVELQLEGGRGVFAVVVSVVKGGPDKDALPTLHVDGVAVSPERWEYSEGVDHLRYRAAELHQSGLAVANIIIISHPFY